MTMGDSEYKQNDNGTTNKISSNKKRKYEIEHIHT